MMGEMVGGECRQAGRDDLSSFGGTASEHRHLSNSHPGSPYSPGRRVWLAGYSSVEMLQISSAGRGSADHPPSSTACFSSRRLLSSIWMRSLRTSPEIRRVSLGVRSLGLSMQASEGWANLVVASPDQPSSGPSQVPVMTTTETGRSCRLAHRTESQTWQTGMAATPAPLGEPGGLCPPDSDNRSDERAGGTDPVRGSSAFVNVPAWRGTRGNAEVLTVAFHPAIGCSAARDG